MLDSLRWSIGHYRIVSQLASAKAFDEYLIQPTLVPPVPLSLILRGFLQPPRFHPCYPSFSDNPIIPHNIQGTTIIHQPEVQPTDHIIRHQPADHLYPVWAKDSRLT